MTDDLTPAELEEWDHMAAKVWEGTLTREPITMAEAERLARQMVIDGRRLPLTTERGTK